MSFCVEGAGERGEWRADGRRIGHLTDEGGVAEASLPVVADLVKRGTHLFQHFNSQCVLGLNQQGQALALGANDRLTLSAPGSARLAYGTSGLTCGRSSARNDRP